jgi:hypothetical protein
MARRIYKSLPLALLKPIIINPDNYISSNEKQKILAAMLNANGLQQRKTNDYN